MCLAHCVTRPGPRMHLILHERDFVTIILLVRKLSFRGEITQSIRQISLTSPMLSPMMLVTQNPCPLALPAAFTVQVSGWESFRHKTTALHGESQQKEGKIETSYIFEDSYLFMDNNNIK